MQLRVRLQQDLISPDLRRRARQVKNAQPLLRAMADVTVNLAKRAFNEPGLRPSSWPAKHGGGTATLRKDQLLARSPRRISVTNRQALVGSDRPYAAVHQLGGQTRARIIRPRRKQALAWVGGPGPRKSVRHPGSKIPARPYWPFYKNGKPTGPLKQAVAEALRARLRSGRRG